MRGSLSLKVALRHERLYVCWSSLRNFGTKMVEVDCTTTCTLLLNPAQNPTVNQRVFARAATAAVLPRGSDFSLV